MKKEYSVELEGLRIGTTNLENTDPPMGVVSGVLVCDNNRFDYAFWKDYCTSHGVKINNDSPEDGLISTQSIGVLRVFNPDGHEITGKGINIEGMDSEGFEITIFGIPYPDYQLEFS